MQIFVVFPNIVMFLQRFHVASVKYSSMANQLYLTFFILWIITLFDHSHSLYPNMGKCKGKFKTAFEFYTPELFIVGDNFGAATKF